VVTSAWTREHVGRIVDDPATYTPVIDPGSVRPMIPGTDFWDLWPVRTPSGGVAAWCGREVWAGLSAPAEGHPGRRHDEARIRLVARNGAGWDDLGPLFPDGASPGSREWAGSTVLDGGRLIAYYTSAGVRGERTPTFRQRLMAASADAGCQDGMPSTAAWSEHAELARADGVRYQPADEATGEPGFIKAFRDPFRYDDAAIGTAHLLFTGSSAGARHPDHNGLVGHAVLGRAGWELLDPLVTADGVNNEMERPHVVARDSWYYLFVSTQQRTFDPASPGPTALYGFAGRALAGPYEPVNGSGLVLRNPPQEPYQAYSWLVLDDLSVTGFVDTYDLRGRSPDDLEREGAAAVRAHFGGTMTPPLQLAVDGPIVTLLVN
jgi:levansucrase